MEDMDGRRCGHSGFHIPASLADTYGPLVDAGSISETDEMQEEQKRINEEWKIWRKNAMFLYDTMLMYNRPDRSLYLGLTQHAANR